MNQPLTAVSLFAGIGGLDEALRRAGIQVVAAVEIDPACRGVLARHFPSVTLFDDVRTVTGDQLRAAGFVPGRGVVAGGWPCTGNSNAGRREGMADPRSGLWVHFARLLAELRPAWFLGENVPGLYSVNDGRDIAVVRGDITQCGYWWAERTLDAQHFGVPQRRRRVFFAGCAGDRSAAVEVLLEPESGGGDSAPRRAAWAGAAAGAGNGAGVPGTVGTLGTTGPGGGWRLGADEAAAGQLLAVPVQDGRDIDKAQNGIGIGEAGALAYTLDTTGAQAVITAATLQGGGRRGHRVDAEGAAGGHVVPFDLAQVTSAANRSNPRPGDPSPPLMSAGQPMVAHALTAEGADASEDGTGRGTPLVAWTVSHGAAPVVGREQIGALKIGTGLGIPSAPAVTVPGAVRRLTPRECERLQGFPDDWTRWTADGREQSDSTRYRQLGNAVAVPVAEWITRRITAVHKRANQREAAA